MVEANTREEGEETISSTQPLLLDETKPVSSVTPVLVLSTFITVCGSFCFGCAMGYSSAAMSSITEEFGLTVKSFSLFGSLLTFGGMIGAVFSGKVAALIGRKSTMWFCDIFCISGWIFIVLAKEVWWLYVGRLLIGIGVGFLSYVVPVYIAEIAPKDIRGGFTFANQLSQNCGFSLVYFFGNFIHWRTLALMGVIPSLIQVVGLFFIPESPRWLAKVGRDKESETALQRLRGKNADVSQELANIREITENFEKNPKPGIFDLFQRRYAYPLTVGIGLMLLQQLSGSSGVVYYASSILKLAGFSTAIGTTTLALLMIPKAILGLLLVDNWGRRPLLTTSAAAMSFSCLLLGVLFSLEGLQSITPLLSFFAILLYVMAFAVGMGGLPWILMSEIFPNDVKVAAGTLVTFTNWSIGWVITYTFNFMLEWSPSGTFFIFSVICGITVLFVRALVPETRGLTLEEIQASIAHRMQ